MVPALRRAVERLQIFFPLTPLGVAKCFGLRLNVYMLRRPNMTSVVPQNVTDIPN
jgi:hypothetical protein